MPHLAIDATPLGGGWSGDEAIVRGLVAGVLASCEAADRVSVLVRRGVELPDSPAAHAAGHVEVVRAPSTRGVRRLTIDVPRATRSLEHRPDVLSSHVHAPIRPACPVALTLTDLSFLHRPEYFPTRIRLRLRTLIPRQARRAAGVLTPTRTLADAVVAELGVERERVHVVPTAVPPARRLTTGEQLAAAAWAAERGVDRPFLLSTGHAFDSRDRTRLIYAFLEAQRADTSLHGVQLVLTGDTRSVLDDAVEHAAAAAPRGTVVRIDRVSPVQHAWLLGQARALVYPALFEGIAFPALEAMAYNVPVVASSLASIPELVGDAALCIDSASGEELADAMVEVITDDAVRAQLVELGRRRVAELTPERTGPAVRAALLAAVEHGRDRAQPRGVAA